MAANWKDIVDAVYISSKPAVKQNIPQLPQYCPFYAPFGLFVCWEQLSCTILFLFQLNLIFPCVFLPCTFDRTM